MNEQLQIPGELEPGDNSRASGRVSEHRADRMLRLAIELRRNGVSESVTRDLLANHALDDIEQQLIWLPYRKAKRRAPLVVAAIKGRYDEPADLWGEEDRSA